ncbi:MAG: hypothetical protein V2A79_09705 [Planctomycetota bacterium]
MANNPLSIIDHQSYDAEFPVTAYDRPTLAMSNLLLRGDIDAATRAIFTPETLSPRELQTMRMRIAGPKPHPLVKTVLDVATNPLVIIGLIGGYLAFPTMKMEGPALLEFYQGLRKAPPVGAIGRFVTGAFARLRSYPGLHEAVMGLERSAAQFSARHAEEFAAAYGSVPAAAKGSEKGWLMFLRKAGFTEPEANWQKIYGKYGAAKRPLLDHSRDFLSAGEFGELGAIDKTGNVFKGILKELQQNPVEWKKLVAEAKGRGIDIGKEIEHYAPFHARPTKWRQDLMRDIPIAPVGQPPRGVAAGSAEDWLASGPISKNLWPRHHNSIPNPDQLRRVEGKGVWVGATDDMLASIDRRVSTFESRLTDFVNRYGQGPEAQKRLAGAIEKAIPDEDDRAQLSWAAARRLLAGGGKPEAVREVALALKHPAIYDLDYAPAMEKYLAKMAPTYAWHIEGHGQRIAETAAKFVSSRAMSVGKGGYDYQYLKHELIPYMTGQRTAKQMSRAVAWNEWKLRKATWLKGHPLAQRLVPEKTRAFLLDKLEDYRFGDAESVGDGISHYLYLSTMGANIGPPAKNVLQNVLTFMNMPGMGAVGLALGAYEVFTRSGPYLANAAKLGVEQAFRKSFPEFVAMMGPSLDVRRMFGASQFAAGTGLGTVARTGIQKAEALAMAPFKATEIVNRLVAFYGARARALGWPGATVETANKVAGNIVDLAHYTGGATGIPAGTLGWWGPWRQFSQFPLRTAGFLIDSVRWGADPLRFDPSTIFRTVGASAAAYTVARGLLGADISQGLLAGALPLPQYESAPFYPAPFVPPLAQMAGNVAMGVMKGEGKPILDTATLLVPGGLAARRLVRTLGRKRADYGNPLPDGRVPVYNDEGGLIGAYSPLQLGLRALGMMPTDIAAERGAAKWLVAQRDRIRTYRRRWLDAQLANDPVAAERVQGDFQRQYPELGPLEFKKSDINALEQRRTVGRLNRIIRGFPSAYKPLFQQMVTEAEIGVQLEGMTPGYELPPGLEALR